MKWSKTDPTLTMTVFTEEWNLRKGWNSPGHPSQELCSAPRSPPHIPADIEDVIKIPGEDGLATSEEMEEAGGTTEERCLDCLAARA